MSTFEAREEIRRAIYRLLKDGPDAALIRRPVIAAQPDGPTRMEPQPLAAIGVLADLTGAVRYLQHEYARNGRGDGLSWAEIGEVLYRDGMPSWERAAEAFRFFASDLGDGPSFSWTCGRCLGLVHDRGPEAGSPHDAERGHAPDCARFGELVRAYNAQWEDGG